MKLPVRKSTEWYVRYVEHTRFTWEGDYIVYWSNWGCIASHSQWMVPGSWKGE